MKVLVTGATGFLGSHTAEILTEHDCEVRALVRATSKTHDLEGLGVECVVGSLEDISSLERAFDGVDAIIHCAGGSKVRTVEELYDKNTTTTVNLMTAARAHASRIKRFVFVSSLAAHGPANSGTPPTPDDPDQPISHYGRSKLRAERRLLEDADHIPVTIVRPPPVYGPRDERTLLAIVRAIKRHVMPLPGPECRTAMIYVEDCAEALYQALVADHPSGRVYYVEDGAGSYTRREMADHIARALGTRGILRFPVPFPLMGAAGFVNEKAASVLGRATAINRDKIRDLKQPFWLCDATSTREELDWQPQTLFAEGARKTVQWYRQHDWI